MSRYMTAFIHKEIDCQYLNKLSRINNLKFIPINNRFVENQLKNAMLQYYLVEWIDSRYDTAITKIDGDIYNSAISELSLLLTELGVELADNFSCDIDNITKEILSSNEQNINRMISFLKNFCSMGYEISVVLHCYSGLIQTEEFVIRDISQVRLQDLETFFKDVVEEDVLYIFKGAI